MPTRLLVAETTPAAPMAPLPEVRHGWPWVLPAVALWAGVVVGVARGFSSQLQIWRWLAASGLWELPHYAVKDDAL